MQYIIKDASTKSRDYFHELKNHLIRVKLFSTFA